MIFDVSGGLLVQSRQLLKLAVAPQEVAGDPKKPAKGAALQRELAQLLARAGVAAPVIARARDTSLKWVPIPGTFSAKEVAGLVAVRD